MHAKPLYCVLLPTSVTTDRVSGRSSGKTTAFVRHHTSTSTHSDTMEVTEVIEKVFAYGKYRK